MGWWLAIDHPVLWFVFLLSMSSFRWPPFVFPCVYDRASFKKKETNKMEREMFGWRQSSQADHEGDHQLIASRTLKRRSCRFSSMFLGLLLPIQRQANEMSIIRPLCDYYRLGNCSSYLILLPGTGPATITSKRGQFLQHQQIILWSTTELYF